MCLLGALIALVAVVLLVAGAAWASQGDTIAGLPPAEGSRVLWSGDLRPCAPRALPAAPTQPAAESPKIVSLTSPTHPDPDVWYASRSATFAWEGPPLSYTAKVLGWNNNPGWGIDPDIWAVDLKGDRLYVSGSEGLHIVDVADPAHAKQLGSYTSDPALGSFSAKKQAVDGGYVYEVVDQWFDDTDEYLGLLMGLDARDPAAPVHLGVWSVDAPFPSGSITDVLARDGYLYLAVNRTGRASGAPEYWLDIWDVHDRLDPQPVGSCQFSTLLDRMTLRGDYLYVGGTQLSVVDVKNPAAPHIVGSVNQYCPGGIAVDDRYVYGGSLTWATMNVFDVTQPSSPSYAGGMEDIWSYADVIDVAITDPDPALYGHYALTSLQFDSNNLSVVCVVDIRRPLLFGEESLLTHLSNLNDAYGGAGTVSCLAVAGNWAYLGHTSSANGLSIVHLGAKAYSYVFDQDPNTIPDTVADGAADGLTASASVSASANGVWYFHVRAQDDQGLWGPAKTRQVKIGAGVSDTTPPVTTASGYDNAWHSSAVTVSFSAVDLGVGASGVAYTEYRLDGGVWTRGTQVTVPAPPGVKLSHAIGYRSADNAGSLEAEKTCTVKIDTTAPTDAVGPVCAAKNVTVKRGQSCRLLFRVYDAQSAQVTQRLAITTKSGVVKWHWEADYRDCFDGWWQMKYICRLTKGSYRIVVSGEDLAGNSASVMGRATLTVK
jgi:hypothetical protein